MKISPEQFQEIVFISAGYFSPGLYAAFGSGAMFEKVKMAFDRISQFSLIALQWTFGGNRANRRPISSKDVTAYGPMG